MTHSQANEMTPWPPTCCNGTVDYLAGQPVYWHAEGCARFVIGPQSHDGET